MKHQKRSCANCGHRKVGKERMTPMTGRITLSQGIYTKTTDKGDAVKLQEAIDKINTFNLHNYRGWDSYDALPVDPRAIESARSFVQMLGDGWVPFPLTDGGIRLEGWHQGMCVEIEIGPDIED